MSGYKKIIGIYCIENSINGKRYVGHSKNIRKRCAHHRNRLRGNKHKNKHLQDSWNLYGGDKFNFSILEVVSGSPSKKELEGIETKWVLDFKTHLSEYGYNALLPGTVPIKEEGGNTCDIGMGKKKKIICLNTNDHSIHTLDSYDDVILLQE